MKILVTCPPMLGMIDKFQSIFDDNQIFVTAPKIIQTLSETELINLVPEHEGWIIGDDIASYKIVEAGVKKNFKGAVKWGIGVDNIDFQAFKDFGIPVSNTPDMFGAEVADIAVGYVIGLARETFKIHENVKRGNWFKPNGISLANKNVGIIGYGDIGKNVSKRLQALGMNVYGYDPAFEIGNKRNLGVSFKKFPDGLSDLDFLVLTCSLNKSTKHLLNTSTFHMLKDGVRIVNVSRGPVINEADLIHFLQTGKVHSAALDVFEIEPVGTDSPLLNFDNIIFGSHNASNTYEAVFKTSVNAIDSLVKMIRA